MGLRPRMITIATNRVVKNPPQRLPYLQPEPEVRVVKIGAADPNGTEVVLPMVRELHQCRKILKSHETTKRKNKLPKNATRKCLILLLPILWSKRFLHSKLLIKLKQI